jgi:hypothetical protein
MHTDATVDPPCRTSSQAHNIAALSTTRHSTTASEHLARCANFGAGAPVIAPTLESL